MVAASSLHPPGRHLDARRGRWLAQQGSTGLRCSSSGPQLRAQVLRGPRRVVPPPQQFRPEVARAVSRSGSSPSDALDELLSHARVTLDHLEGLCARAQQQPQTIPRRVDAPTTIPGGVKMRRRSGPPSDVFWRPRCNAHLWSDGDSSMSCDSGSEEDGFLSTESREDHEESDFEDDPAFWDLLKAAENFAAQAGKARAAGRGFPNIPPPPPMHAGMQPSRRNTSEPPPVNKDKPAKAEPRPGEPPRHSETRSRDSHPHSSAPHFKAASSKQSTADRGQRAGFKFGGGKSQSEAGAPNQMHAVGALTGPEADVRAALSAAQTEGSAVARKVLKQLLLRWHPDKAPQGDSPVAIAAKEEATRVLRFVLQERQRLGL